jgi:hypothetical protein
MSDRPKSDCLWHGGGTQPEHGVQTICELFRGGMTLRVGDRILQLKSKSHYLNWMFPRRTAISIHLIRSTYRLSR